jgi:uncharacterized protein
MTAGSCIYAGWVKHTRIAPRRHAFRYPVWWMLLDLDELPELGRRLRFFSAGRFNLFSIHQKDYGDRHGLLKECVAALLAKAGIAGPVARVKLLTMPRLLGYAFNPLSI